MNRGYPTSAYRPLIERDIEFYLYTCCI